jgi:uncharacterized protein (TIGR02145 family)
MLSAASANAQVLIGGDATGSPATGAILDLRNPESSKGGFLLPRVALTDMRSLVDISGEGKDAAALTGLVVYNTTPATTGIYVWDGNKWDSMVTMARNYCPSVVKDAESNSYTAGWFGTAGCWMTQNLRTKGSLTENGNPGTDTSLKYYWYPGQDASVAAGTADDILEVHPEYGLLYTWAAATGRTGVSSDERNDPNPPQYQGICPNGWHVPSDYEWTQLEEEIAKSEVGVYSSEGATEWDPSYSTVFGDWRGAHGQKMKSSTAVNGIATSGTSNASNANGFAALLVGNAVDGISAEYGVVSSFQCSSSASESTFWRRTVGYSVIGVHYQTVPKTVFRPVRCKKN